MIQMSDLAKQIADGLIVEDEIELAKMAAMVPTLVKALKEITLACAAAETCLSDASELISRLVIAESQIDNISEIQRKRG